jgi:multiple sugar transport system substrate-binding protein
LGHRATAVLAGGKAVTPTDSWSWGIDPSSKHKGAALKILSFASLNQQGNEATAAKIFIPPANAKAFEVYKTKLDDQVGAKTKGAAALMDYELRNTAVHRPRSVGYTQFEDLMLKTFDDIRNGANPQTRLAQAQKDVAGALQQLR